MQTLLNKKTNFFERLLQIIDYYNIKSVNLFATDWLGYASSEKINRLKKGNALPSYQIIVDITNRFEEINPRWLLTGDGDMLISGTSIGLPAQVGEPIVRYGNDEVKQLREQLTEAQKEIGELKDKLIQEKDKYIRLIESEPRLLNKQVKTR
ncbi:MAG: hypothetical protein AAGU19_07815 [Prolixibacteraceae bacterium]